MSDSDKVLTAPRKRTLAASVASDVFWPAEPVFVDSHPLFQFEPANCKVIRGQQVSLKFSAAANNAYDIEWYAHTPVDGIEHVVVDNGNRSISDTPMHDTIYEVRYKTIAEKHNEKVGGPALYTSGHRLAVLFTVENNFGESFTAS